MNFITRDINSALEPPKCECLGETTIRRKPIRGGGFQLKHQCMVCGAAVGSAIAHDKFNIQIDEWDLSLEAAWKENVNKFYRDNAFQLEQNIENKSTQWWKQYNKYLLSEQWRDRRDRIFRRAGYICEGCGAKPASQVHHLSYKNVGKEFLWEIVAVCDDCHARCHEK